MIDTIEAFLASCASALWSGIIAIPKPLSEFLIQAGATLTGAFVAFRLESRRQDSLRQAKDAASARRALYALLANRTFLLNLDKQELKPLIENRHRDFIMKPIPVLSPRIGVEVTELAFLLETVHADLLNKTEVSDRDFATVLAILEARNAMHARFQDRLEERTVEVPLASISLDSVPGLVGPTIRNNLRELTDQLYEMTDRALASNRKIYVELEAAFKYHFPNERFFVHRELRPDEQAALPN